MSFRALVVETNQADVSAQVRELTDDQLPSGEVMVDVLYSTVNYKDALCLLPGGGGLVRSYPHVPGIDFSGVVHSSTDARYQAGDRVVLTGWRVGESHWGGLSQRARVSADWLVPLPEALSAQQAMAVGTAGVAAMLAIVALENQGLEKADGSVLVTGAAGGVGSIATAVLSQLGYQVAAVTGRRELTGYLHDLGATSVIDRSELSATIKKPLESERWSGCVDAVGGTMLARVLGQMKYGASVAAVGLAGGADLPTSVIPFLLRGVNLLGIDSVMQPYEKRLTVWQRLATDLPLQQLDAMTQIVSLAEVPKIASQVLKGKVQGRVVVDVNAS